MKLKEFIFELEQIYKQADNPDQIDVSMADYIPVVKPIFSKSENIIFITDISEGGK